MASFIDLNGSIVWSEADIVRRTESMIASEFTPDQVAILNRVATAAALGQYTLSTEEMADIGRYNSVCMAAREAGNAARIDNAALAAALAYEAAQATVAAADADTLALVAQRAASREVPA